ncbi:hypothetical protein ACQKMI_10465 [Lysinibacillus sp. NPDC097214]
MGSDLIRYRENVAKNLDYSEIFVSVANRKSQNDRVN